jgi:YD repeat-containing protein
MAARGRCHTVHVTVRVTVVHVAGLRQPGISLVRDAENHRVDWTARGEMQSETRPAAGPRRDSPVRAEVTKWAVLDSNQRPAA